MPQRSNLFQETIALIHHHLAGDATIRESELLVQRTTGAPREVDVVVRGTVAGHEVVVGIEATAKARKADLPWVESMLGKHDDLPTTQLVLVSEAGFTEQARQQAEAKGAVPVSPADLAGDHPGRNIIDSFAELSLREVAFKVKAFIVEARRPSGEKLAAAVPSDLSLYTSEGTFITTLARLVQTEIEVGTARFGDIDPFAAADGPLEVVTPLRPPWNLPAGIVAEDVYVRGVDPPELHALELVEVHAEGAIDVDSTTEMTSRQLGDVAYSYGETRLAGQPAIVVLTADEKGGELSIRSRGGGPWRSV